MVYVLHYNIEETDFAGRVVFYNKDYTVLSNLQDIIEYEFEKKYKKKYRYLEYHLEEGGKEFVKSIEEKWYKNQIDEVALSDDRDFIDWMKNKYYKHLEFDIEAEEVDSLNKAMMAYYNMLEE